MATDPLAPARAAFAAGKLAEAKRLVEARLALQPKDYEAMQIKGLCLFREGQSEAAVALLRAAIAGSPKHLGFIGNLGRVYAALGRYSEAEASFRQALAIKPESVTDLEDLGTALCCLERYDEGGACYERALKLAPGRGLVELRLARVRIYQNRIAEATAMVDAVARREPVLGARVALLRGQIAGGEGDWLKAIGFFAQAIQQGDPTGEARAGRARARLWSEDREGAVADAEAARGLPQQRFEAELILASAHGGKDLAASERAIEAALAMRPHSYRARWQRAMLLRPVYETEEEIAAARAQWRARVEALASEVRPEKPETINEASIAIQEANNFSLNYHGRDDRPEQELYGGLLHRIAATRYPQYRERPRRRPQGRRPRVGFISGFLRRHSIWKTHSAWIMSSSATWEKFVFYAGNIDEPGYTDRVRAAADHFLMESSVPRLIQALAEAELDALIWLDHGMMLNLQLPAALWFAPIQANGLGHPITSGLPTFSHAISSALMEPPEGDTHYTERLVRLPGSASCYERARIDAVLAALEPPERDPSRVRYLCSQNLQKYLPRHDWAFAAIAEGVPAAEFHFLGRDAAVIQPMQRRLERAFAARGLDWRRHCVFHGYLGQDDFFRLNRRCDVFLDGMMWSGNNTAHEAVACGLPIVHWPGPMMRGRHCLALLTMMDMPELIASTPEDYVALATRLGREPDFRAAMAAKTQAGATCIFDDPSPIAGLDAWLTEAIEAGL